MVTLSQKSRILKLNVCHVLWQCMNSIHNIAMDDNLSFLQEQSLVEMESTVSLFHLSPAWMRTPPLAWAVFRAILCKFTFLSTHGSMMDILSLFIKTFFLHPLPDRTLCFYTEFFNLYVRISSFFATYQSL